MNQGHDIAGARYVPQDELYLWWLARPQAPVLIGELRWVPSLRGASLQYDTHWRQHGFALSEDLPLLDHLFLPQDKDMGVGAVDDARPDRWGERVIRLLDRPARLSVMAYLYLAGDARFGALGGRYHGMPIGREPWGPCRIRGMPTPCMRWCSRCWPVSRLHLRSHI